MGDERLGRDPFDRRVVTNGLDQEMPGDKYYGGALEEAVRNGKVSMSTIDQHVRNILVPMFRQGLFDTQPAGAWTANVRSAEHDAFARTAAEQGTVLLRNERQVLPLKSAASV